MELQINPNKLVRITENHGGYLSGECVVCGASGWFDGKLGRKYGDKKNPGADLEHKKNCPINKEI